jgi:hypothetical protein
MKRLIFFSLIAFFLMLSEQAQAQDYKTAVGLRVGYPAAVSLKHFLTESSAVEIYGGARFWVGYRALNVSGAYLIHRPLDITELGGSFKWYFGAGGTAYFWSFNNTFLGNNYGSTTFGVQGYLGLEYTFDDLPLSISADWVPTVFLGSGIQTGFGAGYGGFAVRYILNE